MNNRELIINKITGFFLGAMELGYDYNEAWSLLLNSEQGRGILEEDYTYMVHFQGKASAMKADNDIGADYHKTEVVLPDLLKLKLLAQFIYFAHDRFAIKYDDIFKNISVNDFMSQCGCVLGNYDDKLIKSYILDES